VEHVRARARARAWMGYSLGGAQLSFIHSYIQKMEFGAAMDDSWSLVIFCFWFLPCERDLIHGMHGMDGRTDGLMDRST
jgi:hypothetical protein